MENPEQIPDTTAPQSTTYGPNEPRKFPKIGLAVLVLLMLGLGGLAWYSASAPNDNMKTTKVEAKSAEEVHEECEDKSQPSEIFTCYELAFKTDMEANGAKSTLVMLEQLERMGGYAKANCHPLSHKVGNIALHHYGTVLAASPHYLPVCYSGYYHGILEEYLGTVSDYQTGVVTACGKLEDKVYMDWFQCTHGLGHGIMQYRENDVLVSVKDCDLVDPGNAAREICYAGVFMENITTDQKTGHPSKFIKAEDPIYPCNIVETKYKSACYFLASSMILRLNSYNFPDAFKKCSTAEVPYRHLCFQSLGRDVSGTYLRDIAKVNELCPLAESAYIGDCYYGAVRDFINEKGEFDTGLAMCEATPEAYKPSCYSAMIFDLGLFKSGQAYIDICNRMPQTYKTQCLASKRS